jgi:flagellar motor protein MotB
VKRRVLALGGLALLCAACGGATQSVPRLADAEKVRQTPAAQEAQRLAPQMFATGDAERVQARRAHDDGDDVAAVLYADRSIAAYEHAFVLARLARATKENDDAQSALTAAAAHARELSASRQQIDAEGERLEQQLAVAREAQPTVASGPADPKREGARLVAVRALVAEARLLCGSARLVAPDAPGLADAEKDVTALETQIEQKPHPAPIDLASRARAKCLHSLSSARRAAGGGGNPTSGDALLAELSASGGLDPSRDERGVVISLRDLFEGKALGAHGQEKLGELGRVAAAHPDVGVQVVVHDANTPSKTDADADLERADTVVKALVAAGAKGDHVKGEAVGAKAPIVDPGDAAHRARNARVDVVFVTR